MSVPTEIARIKGLRNGIRSRLIEIGALSDETADLQACYEAMSNVSTLTLSNIAIATPPDKTLYSPGDSFDPTGMVVTATFDFGGDSITFDISDYTYSPQVFDIDDTEVVISYTFGAITKTTTQEVGCYDISETLSENSWAAISWVARHGLGSTYWNIGDRKAVTLNGRVGHNTQFYNDVLYVYILDFNHPENGIPENNILFGGFFTAAEDGKDVCIVDSFYNTQVDLVGLPDGVFVMNSSARSVTTSGSYSSGGGYIGANLYTHNFGGWKGCDFRYDVLGATEHEPSLYSKTKDMSTFRPTDKRGYDATQAAITNPVSNTLMAALPSDFRNALRLRTHYVNNLGASESDRNPTLMEVTDAISVLTEVEVNGTCQYASPEEEERQTQMAYYADGGSKVKYKHNATGTAAIWHLASPRYAPNTVGNSYTEKTATGLTEFCAVTNSGAITGKGADYSLGLAPVFKI